VVALLYSVNLAEVCHLRGMLRPPLPCSDNTQCFEDRDSIFLRMIKQLRVYIALIAAVVDIAHG